MNNRPIILFTVIWNLSVFGQVGINNNNPDSSAMLDIRTNGTTNNKGVLLPRIYLTSAVDNTTIVSPAKGLSVFNINGLIGEGIYVNEGTSVSPLWQRMKTVQSDALSRYVSTMAYTGATTSPANILESDTFQWRLISGGSNYELQARLKNIPAQDIITTPTYLLRWNGTATGITVLPSFTWILSGWDSWQTLYSFTSADQGLFYFGIQGTDKLFRVNAYTVTDSYNSLLVEQF
jgi:hypothetical protein